MNLIQMIKTGCFAVDKVYQIFEKGINYKMEDELAERVIESGHGKQIQQEQSTLELPIIEDSGIKAEEAISINDQGESDASPEKSYGKNLKNKALQSEKNKNGV